MLAIERRKLILEQLHREKRVVVSELSRKFSVSEETIRRDLDKFEKDDLVTKSYGGAVLKEDVGAEMPFKDRKKRNMLGKRVIGDILSEIIRDGDHILLDPSTTALSIVKALRSEGKKDLTIITNSLEVLEGCKLEASLADAQAPAHYQFLRLGYFCVDSKDSKPGALVFNRAVSLKDSFKPGK